MEGFPVRVQEPEELFKMGLSGQPVCEETPHSESILWNWREISTIQNVPKTQETEVEKRRPDGRQTSRDDVMSELEIGLHKRNWGAFVASGWKVLVTLPGLLSASPKSSLWSCPYRKSGHEYGYFTFTWWLLASHLNFGYLAFFFFCLWKAGKSSSSPSKCLSKGFPTAGTWEAVREDVGVWSQTDLGLACRSHLLLILSISLFGLKKTSGFFLLKEKSIWESKILTQKTRRDLI